MDGQLRLSQRCARLVPTSATNAEHATSIRRGTIDDLTKALFADFADHLVPEAFAEPTRANRVHLEPDGLEDHLDGEPGRLRFQRWADQRLFDAFDVTWPDGDHPFVVVFTSDGRLLRRYQDPGCGHVDCVVEVVRQDVASVSAPWLFAAWMPRPQPSWQQIEIEPGIRDEVLVPPTDLRWGALWYAEARGRGVAASTTGMAELHADELVARHPTEISRWDATRDFHRILYRHPARRRHPLRRRR